MAAMQTADDLGAVVMDCGSAYSRAGYAGEDTPRVVFPSWSGYEYLQAAEATPGEEPDVKPERKRKLYASVSELDRLGSDVKVASPIERGLVTDWELLGDQWEFIFNSRLHLDPTLHPVMMSEAPFSTAAHREKAVQMAFERFQVPALFIAKTAELSSFASQRVTGVVVDVGGGVTCATPVYEGTAVTKSVVRSDFAGEDLNSIMLKSAQQYTSDLRPTFALKKHYNTVNETVTVSERPGIDKSSSHYHRMQLEVVRGMKEGVCRLSEGPFDVATSTDVPKTPYELPDNSILELGAERFSIPELLFDPSLLDKNFEKSRVMAVHQLVHECVSKCEPELHKELYNNIVIAGGSTLFPGFPERLQKELYEMAIISESAQHLAHKIKIHSPNPQERKYSSWIGGSMLASLGSHSQMWLSKAEYEEHGPSLVERKCLHYVL